MKSLETAIIVLTIVVVLYFVYEIESSKGPVMNAMHTTAIWIAHPTTKDPIVLNPNPLSVVV